MSAKMNRRKFITLLGGEAAAWPLAARAQQPPKMARLGYLAPARLPNLIEALRAGLRDLGYIEGQNLAIEYRFALGQTKSYDELAQELVRLDPAAIVLTGTPAALALKRQTTTIPIILAPIADPLALGLARSHLFFLAVSAARRAAHTGHEVDAITAGGVPSPGRRNAGIVPWTRRD